MRTALRHGRVGASAAIGATAASVGRRRSRRVCSHCPRATADRLRVWRTVAVPRRLPPPIFASSSRRAARRRRSARTSLPSCASGATAARKRSAKRLRGSTRAAAQGHEGIECCVGPRPWRRPVARAKHRACQTPVAHCKCKLCGAPRSRSGVACAYRVHNHRGHARSIDHEAPGELPRAQVCRAVRLRMTLQPAGHY